MTSHPSWVRGLKHGISGFRRTRQSVAPLVGAWIETADKAHVPPNYGVAPLVGAWIETQFFSGLCKITTRRTPRGCVD